MDTLGVRNTWFEHFLSALWSTLDAYFWHNVDDARLEEYLRNYDPELTRFLYYWASTAPTAQYKKFSKPWVTHLEISFYK